MLDPNDFVITRKRKKYRFAKFANSPLCFEFDEWRKQSVDCIEIGAGTGLFSVELAARSPEKEFVAIDVKGDRLQKGAYEAEARGIKMYDLFAPEPISSLSSLRHTLFRRSG